MRALDVEVAHVETVEVESLVEAEDLGILSHSLDLCLHLQVDLLGVEGKVYREGGRHVPSPVGRQRPLLATWKDEKTRSRCGTMIACSPSPSPTLRLGTSA